MLWNQNEAEPLVRAGRPDHLPFQRTSGFIDGFSGSQESTCSKAPMVAIPAEPSREHVMALRGIIWGLALSVPFWCIILSIFYLFL